jgi:hypothetical protein
MKTYSQLTEVQRYQIEVLKKAKKDQKRINRERCASLRWRHPTN